MFASSVEFFIFVTLSLCWFTESNLYGKGNVTGKFEEKTKFQTFTLIASESTSLNGGNMDFLTTENHSHAAKFFDFQLVGKIAVPIITIIGILGKSMSIIIINQKNFRKQSISLILTCLAISDSMVLLLFVFNKKFMMEFLDRDAREISQEGCVIFFWIFRTSKMTSSWFVVLISIERFIAVWFPFKSKEINSR